MNLKEKQIIYVDNKPHIKCGVIILPTNKEAKIGDLSIIDGILKQTFSNCIEQKLQHLYITSNEKIKEGDWCYKEDVKNKIFKWVNTENDWYNDSKKIIATTNTSLKSYHFTKGVFKDLEYSLPQPSHQFIEKYIEEYNKGNVITKILVEVELINKKEYIDEQDAYGYDNFIYKLKRDSQNQITIRKQKDNWNREEMHETLHEFVKFANEIFDSSRFISVVDLDKWIEKKL